MRTSSVIQLAAASLEEAASARSAVRANRTRSTLGSSLRPVSCPRITASRPSRRQIPSRTLVPPIGREPLMDSSPGVVAATAPAGSSSRDSAETSRLTESLSSSSSRPKEYRILVRETPAAPSHSLWASCRYRMTWPSLVLREDAFTYTPRTLPGCQLGDKGISADQPYVIAWNVSLEVLAACR